MTLESLRAKLGGVLALPGDHLYAHCRQLDNGRIQQFPIGVVLATSVDDVVQAIAFARENRLPLHVKAGGHSYAGYSVGTDGLLLDLSHMKEIVFRPSTQEITLQMGTVWADVYDFLESSGTDCIPVGGACTGVGVAGFVLGGGYSFVSRSYGLACDSLVSVTIVTADGMIRRVGPDSAESDERDLFWACQGGGGGNFGVVVDMTLRTHRPRASQMLAGALTFDLPACDELLPAYDEWVRTLPDEMSVYGFFGKVPDPSCPHRLRDVVRFQPVFNGRWAEGMDLLKPLLDRRPLWTALYSMPLPDYLRIAGKSTAFAGRSSYSRSGMLHQGNLTADFARICREQMLRAPSSSSFMLWMHQGGHATKSIPVDATAFVHRSADYVFEVAAIWDHADDTSVNVEWAFDTGTHLSEFFHGAYVNYIDPLLANWQRMYYGSNYLRLANVKKRWDPGNLFAFQQGIGSPHEPSQSKPLRLEPLKRTSYPSTDAG